MILKDIKKCLQTRSISLSLKSIDDVSSFIKEKLINET